MSSTSEISFFIENNNYLSAISLASSLCRSSRSDIELTEIMARLRSIPEVAWSDWIQREVRIVFSSGSTLRHLEKKMKTVFALHRIGAKIEFLEYDIPGDALNTPSSVIEFKPNFFVIHPTSNEISNWPELGISKAEYDKRLERETEQFNQYAQNAHANTKSKIILDSLAPYPYAPLGLGETSRTPAKKTYLEDLNVRFKQISSSRLTIHPLDQIASSIGIRNWHDSRMWNQAKIDMSTFAAEAYIKSIANLVASELGLNKKCLVLDLDNTLWGGVIGDAGLRGISVGTTSPEGEAFVSFQRYCLELKKQGVLLAVASKNEFSLAVEPFQKLDDMVLKESDIEVFEANWGPKSESLQRIANRLNIGADALVFFDDNPAERMEVLLNSPQVSVVDVPDDPANFLLAIDTANFFQNLNLTTEDMQRAQQYQIQKEFSVLEKSSTDLDSFLRSLEMTAVISQFKSDDLTRISQLINKTNQFNLTSRRYTDSDCIRIMNDPKLCAFTIRLKDRFTDHGLISVLIAGVEGSTARIDTWLMSCRVLKRGVEELALEILGEKLQKLGAQVVMGEFIPTKKNMMVADLLPRLAFERSSETDASENVLFERSLPFTGLKHFINVAKD